MGEMRILLCSLDLAGHFNPLIPFIEAARTRGDEVTVVAPPRLAQLVQDLGVAHRISDEPHVETTQAIWDRATRATRSEAVHLIDGELFGLLWTSAMLPAVEAACDEFSPHVILREPCAYAGAVAATSRGIAHGQVAISTAQTEWGCIDLVAPILGEFTSGVEQSMRVAPYLTRFPVSLDPSPFPRTVRYRESVSSALSPDGCAWEKGDRPLVYVTFGSIAGGLPSGEAAFRVAIDAVSGLGATVLITTGRDFDPAVLGPLPADVFVERWVPQSQVVASADVVVCHGGSGTSYGALAAGLPIVFVPMFADQLTNAQLISGAGAGMVVEASASGQPGFRVLGSSDGPRIRDAVVEVIANDSYRLAAQRLAGEIRLSASVGDSLALVAPLG
jgi:UDP:flavonoid glycosyltransferase YjiC (YdhE family)